jgi:CRP-like cAMP-binding protein
MIKIFKIEKNALVSTGNNLIIIDSGKVKDYDEQDDNHFLSKGNVISLFNVGNNNNTYDNKLYHESEDEFSSSSEEENQKIVKNENFTKNQKNENFTKNAKNQKISKKSKNLKKKIYSIDLLKILSPSLIFAIPIDNFNKLLLEHTEKLNNEKMKFISNIFIFKFLEERKLLQLSEFMQKKFIYKDKEKTSSSDNTIILSEEDTIDRIYIIASGTVKCHIENSLQKRLQQGDYFGDIALFCSMESLFTYSCNSDVVLFELKFSHVIEILGENYLKDIIFTIFLNTMKNSEYFSRHLAKHSINNFFNLFSLKYYFKDVVITQKQPKLCIIISGNLLSSSKNLSKKINSNLASANNSPVKSFKKNSSNNNVNNVSNFNLNLNSCYNQNLGNNLNLNLKSSSKSVISNSNLNLNLTTNSNSKNSKNQNFQNFSEKNISINFENNKNLVGCAGDLFGDIILDNNHSISSNVISEDECVIFEANWYDLLKCFKPIISTNSYVSLYDRILILKNTLTHNSNNNFSIFSNLSEWKFFLLAEKLNIEIFKDKEQIANNIHDKFYIIKSGKVSCYLNNILFKEFSQGESFGEISGFKLYSKSITYIANGKVEFYTLTKKSYDEVVEDVQPEDLENNCYKKRSIAIYKDEKVKLENLFFVKDLGHGSFGKVFKVHNGTNFYAVKVAEIKNCRKNKLFRYYINEKTIMSSIDHPFIVKLINTFKNKEHIFIIMECIDGLNLGQYLEKRKKKKKITFNKNFRNKIEIANLYEAQFYGAILLTIANYLQRIRVIHRDIKPANCMIEKNGYLKLIDFGVAKDLSSRDHTTTLIGTSHYMAPEIILGKGYGFSADYWSIGIVMYEILYGNMPFGSGSMGLIEVYDEITEK